ncbi:MAG: S9 family peptidase [Paludibacteraceae bacterium]|nr:S9 family peptidase [Paludibacteraceae bacterium]
MDIKNLLVMALVATSLVGCNLKSKSDVIDESNDPEYIGRNEIKVENGRMSAEVLWAFGRLSDIQVSPDGKKVIYGVQYYSVAKNKSNRELFIMNVDGTDVQQITKTVKSEYAAKWVKDGEKIAFITPDNNDVMQLWEMNADGSQRTQISKGDKDVVDYIYSADSKQVILIHNVKYGETATDLYPDLDKTTGRVVTDLMYKHWDEWTDNVPHPFVYDYDGEVLTNARDILEGEPFESPVKPFGGAEQITFTPDGKQIAYTCKKKKGIDYALSTNNDIYLYDIAAGKTIKNLTDSMMGYDINPVFSHDGTMMAWESMEHDGYESDKNRLFIQNMATGERTDLTLDFDQCVGTLNWSADDKQIYFTSCWHGEFQIYVVDIATKEFRTITQGVHDYEQIALAGDRLLGVRHSMSMPNEIYSIDINSGAETQISFENKAILDQLTMGEVTERWITTTDGKKMLVWVIFPPQFDANKKYPTLLYCEGGPQSPVSQFWSYRWNFQMMAAHDYIIVAPNRRGLVGFGQEWLEEISGDYGGQCMTDLFTAIDTVSLESYVDTAHRGCVGASFGGYTSFWMAGHHDKRFKAFIAHDGMFNLEQQYLETEEMFFVNWDLGGAYWEPVTANTYANSPHRFVDKWDTPIMVIHGEKDYRILASQGMAAYNAAKLRGLDAELLIFPDENHWVLQPQNGVLWQRRFFNWLDKYLK